MADLDCRSLHYYYWDERFQVLVKILLHHQAICSLADILTLAFVGMVRPSNGAVAAALAIVVSAGLTFPFFLTKGKTVSPSRGC